MPNGNGNGGLRPWIDTIKQPRVIAILLAGLVLEGFSWNLITAATGGAIKPPKTEVVVEIQCIKRVLDNEDIDEQSLRGSITSCLTDEE